MLRNFIITKIFLCSSLFEVEQTPLSSKNARSLLLLNFAVKAKIPRLCVTNVKLQFCTFLEVKQSIRMAELAMNRSLLFYEVVY